MPPTIVNHLKSKHKQTAVELEIAEKSRKSNGRNTIGVGTGGAGAWAP